MLGAGSSITPTIRLVRQLGAGGMGSVWIADHLALQTQVVVKFMHADLARDEGSLARFSREAVSASNVKSPHVVQVLDHGVADGAVPFIVMELLEGCDLSTHLERHGPMPLDQVDRIVTQTCKALSRAHERGIVHRDIKPENLFLCNLGDGEIFVKVLDFGIAKSQGVASMSATKTGALMGTPYYMSPEQTIGAKTIDSRSDLWSLGVVAFECMTGRRPFEAETVGGLAVAICGGPIPQPSTFLGGMSPEIDAWFFRACARDPSQRFASAKEMANALHTAVTGRASSARISVENTLPLPQDNRTLPLALVTGRQASSAQLAPTALQNTTHAPVSQAEEAMGVPKRGSGSVLAVVAGSLVLAAGATIFLVVFLRNHGADPPVQAGPGTPSVSVAAPAPVLPPIVATPLSASATTPPPISPPVLPPVVRTGGPRPATSRSAAPAASSAAQPKSSAPPATTKPPDRNSID